MTSQNRIRLVRKLVFRRTSNIRSNRFVSMFSFQFSRRSFVKNLPLRLPSNRCSRFFQQPTVNFINIIQVGFCTKRRFGSFFYMHVTRKKLPKQLLYKKPARIMLMKLTPSVNFITVLRAVFTCVDPKSTENYKLYCIFALLWSVQVKAASKMLMKSTPIVNFINISPAAFVPISFSQKLQTQTVISKKLSKTLKHKKGACKMLVKLTPIVNFYQHLLSSFFYFKILFAAVHFLKYEFVLIWL